MLVAAQACGSYHRGCLISCNHSLIQKMFNKFIDHPISIKAYLFTAFMMLLMTDICRDVHLLLSKALLWLKKDKYIGF